MEGRLVLLLDEKTEFGTELLEGLLGETQYF
jgi:hypothetical protein